jgi:hypothetical protein
VSALAAGTSLALALGAGGLEPWFPGSMTLGVGATFETRAEWLSLEGSSAARATNVEMVPEVSLAFAQRRARQRVHYAPRLVFQDRPGEPNELVLHGAGGTAEWLGWRDWKLRGAIAGSYGRTRLRPIDRGLSAPLDAPVLTALDYSSFDAGVELDGRASPALALRGTARYSMAGGRGASLAQLTRYEGPEVTATVEWLATRRGGLRTTGRVASYRFSPVDEEGLEAAWLESWRQGFGRDGELVVGAGLGYASSTLPTLEPTWQRAPVVEGAVRDRWHVGRQTIDLNVQVRTGPVVDRYSATVFRRTDVSGWAGWAPRPKWLVTAVLGTAMLHREAAGLDRALYTEVKIARELAPGVSLAAGTRGALQDRPAPELSYREATSFLLVSLSMPDTPRR